MSTVKLQVASPEELQSNPPPLAEAQWRFLCEGDSWFTIGALNPFKSANLLEHLRFSKLCWAINCGTPGDTLTRMVKMNTDPHFTSLLADTPMHRVRPWDALLVSAGGNDLIDAIGVPPAFGNEPVPIDRRLLRTAAEWGPAADGPARYVSEGGWSLFAGYLQANLRHLISVRDHPDSQSKGVPVFMHTYALAVPRDAGAGAGLGPWLWPSLKRFGVPAADGAALSAHLLRRLAALLEACRADPGTYPNLHVFDSQQVPGIVPADADAGGTSGDWVNEIHLTAAGCAKLAAAWAKHIEAVMSSR